MRNDSECNQRDELPHSGTYAEFLKTVNFC